VDDATAFRAFVEANGPGLLHAARLLTGDHQRGEDLVQTTLTKLYLKWDRVSEPLSYARRALVTGHIDETRRRRWHERPIAAVPESPAADQTGHADERHELRRMLRQLEPRERAVVVLRYYCDLSERQAADVLGMPIGTVKSTGARALARLRVEAGASAGR
jgi:RNA polymerase sigma-70 factor (sigma-E family)